MKKNIFNWMTIALMAFMCVGFAACGGSGDDGSNGGYQQGAGNNVLVGTWKCSTTHPWDIQATLIFKSDGSGSIDRIDRWSNDDGNFVETYSAQFRYSILTVDANTQSGYVRIVITSNTTSSDDDVSYKVGQKYDLNFSIGGNTLHLDDFTGNGVEIFTRR